MVSDIGSRCVGKCPTDQAEISGLPRISGIIPIDILKKLAWITNGPSCTRVSIKKVGNTGEKNILKSFHLFRRAYELLTCEAEHCSWMESSDHTGHTSTERCWDSEPPRCDSSHVPFHCGQTCCIVRSDTFLAHQKIPLRTEATHLDPGTALEEKKGLMAGMLLFLSLLFGVDSINVHVELVPARESLTTVFARVFKSAGEVDRFHMVLCVHFLSIHLPTNATAVLSTKFTLNNLHNILCQEISIAA